MPAKPTWTRAAERLPLGSALREHPLSVDAALALGLLTVSLLLGNQAPPGDWHRADLLGNALTCVINLSLAVRRRAPLTVLVLGCALWTWYVAADCWPVVNSPAALLALYTVAAHRPRRAAALGAALVASVWMYAGIRTGDSPLLPLLAQSVAWSAVVWRFGDSSRQLGERNRGLAEAAARLRREQEERARRAVTDERARIARELHDVVAHHMSVISVQAGLADYVFETDGATARTALRTVMETSGEALQEMRRLLEVLRVTEPEPDGSAEPYDPAPGLARLDELVQRVRAAGLRVEVTVQGTARPLPPGADLCTYRVVQESLTNVLKHAGPQAAAAVRLHYGPDVFTASVGDDGGGTDSGGTGSGGTGSGGDPGGGHGLVGMRERARLYGGTLVAGPRPGGGFDVVLTLPAAARPTDGPDHRPDAQGENA